MDKKTLNAYSALADAYSDDWLAQPEPTDMYELLEKYFQPGGKTADIGCGNGRDANWLAKKGFKVFGFDSSKELLAIASQLFPNIRFQQSSLPDLEEITDQYENVICETVIMHLPQDQVTRVLDSLRRILSPNGILYLSWRVTEGEDGRHSDGRLYSAFSPETILDHFKKSEILHMEDKISASSGKRVFRLIYRNS